MRVIAGRWLTDTEPTPAFVVNGSLARRYFSSQNPIGKRIQIEGPPGATAAAGAIFAPIVGVVADLKYSKLETSPEPEIFADYRHASPFTITIAARVTGDPLAVAPAIHEIVTAIDKSQVSEVRTVESVLTDSIASRRFTAFLLGTDPAVTRVMTTLLYDVSPTDPATFAMALAVLGASALGACCGPAVKTARVDPMVALKYG
jgi:hypothetical protein